ncbi:MAG: hypothetical protein ACR2RL_11625, partial [Gammaproteobacteria bacterium]
PALIEPVAEHRGRLDRVRAESRTAVCAAIVRGGSDVPGPGARSCGARVFHLHASYTDRLFTVGDL